MRRLCLAAALVALGAPAGAQRFDDRVAIQAGAYFPRIESSLQIGLPDRPGTSIDLEDDLGLDRQEVLPAVEVGWRINDDWVLAAEFYAVGRSTGFTLERDIIVGDTTYPVNGRVTTGFDSDIYRLTISNLFLQRPKWELGAAFGVHMTDFAVFIEGEGSIAGNPGAFRREQRSLFAPLPTVGGVFRWEPTERLQVTANVDWLSLTIDDYSGRLINAEIAASYRVWRRVDLGVLLRRVDYRVDVNRENWVGGVRYRLAGPSVFVQLGF